MLRQRSRPYLFSNSLPPAVVGAGIEAVSYTHLQKFRLRNLQLLVATDVAARGLDVTDLTHVINYGLPDDIETCLLYTSRCV